MAKNLTPEEIALKHAERLRGATTAIRQGVERVTEAPGQAAAKAEDKMKARLLEKINDGTWAKRVAAVSLDDWRKAMLDKGVGRIGEGIDAAHDKQVRFYTELGEEQDKINVKLDKMPNVTLDDNIARSALQIRSMAKFRKT